MDPSSPVRAASGSPMPEMLTPRSKVAKMLADIDNAATPSPPMSRPAISHAQISPKPRVGQLESTNVVNTAPSGPFQADSTDESADDSEDEVRRPLGRAARRMLGGQRTRQSPSPQPHRNDAAVSTTGQARPLTQDDDDEDLYSATPAKYAAHKATPRRRALSGSPIGSARSTNSLALFVSPAKSTQHDSDDELPRNPFGSKERLAELVAQKRAERIAREKENQNQKEHASAEPFSDLPAGALEDPEEAPNQDIERILSDASRPARQASKKALLEMERETQRLSRQQALAHQMKVKKRFTTSELLAKFNFRQQTYETPLEPTHEAASSSAPNSDSAEHSGKEPVSTPPSSPPTPLDRQRAIVDYGALSKLVPVREDSIANLTQIMDDDEELPSAEEVFGSSQAVKSIAKITMPEELAAPSKSTIMELDDSSDEELEIIPALPKHLRAFDNIRAPTKDNPGNSSKAIHTLKHLSHIGSYDSKPRKKGSRPSVNANALEAQLRLRAKTQALEIQQERIAELKARGIEIQSAEDRDKEAEAFENLLEGARQAAVDLRKAEKAARKAERGHELNLEASDDESEDEEYVGFGSEDEEMDGEEREDEANDLLDQAAEESEGEEGEESVEELEETEADAEPSHEEIDDDEMERFPVAGHRKSRKSHIIDEDDEDETAEPEPENHAAPAVQTEEDSEDPFAAFGFGANNTNMMLLSPTQAFNATMQTPTQATQEESFDILRNIAPPSISAMAPTFQSNDVDTQSQEESQVNMVPGSQAPHDEHVDLAWETQPPQTPLLKTARSGLSETPGWEPTQDPGLPSPWTVGLRRESTIDSLAAHDTQSTVQLRVSESPVPSMPNRRGRLTRRQAVEDSDSEDEMPASTAGKAPNESAFNVMARRRKDALTVAEREAATKEAKAMMDEQAEESEDEYTGLGGDDYIAPETEQDKEMIDSSHIDVDERALAAHFADRQRLADEAETSKLYKDLTTGALRRKQANAFDLDEDEDDIAVRRRQMRQREETRKRKLLLQDDNIAGLAEGRNSRGKEAFLKAIADNDGEDDMLDLSDDGGENDAEPATQDDNQDLPGQAPTALREISGNKRRMSDDEDETDGRPPAKQRRTASSAFRKPKSIFEVRESLSFLLEEPNSVPVDLSTVDLENEFDEEVQFSDEEDENEEEAEKARQNDGGYAPNPASFDAALMPPPRLPASQRRTALKTAVVDRLSLKRGSSTSSTDSGHGATAWGASASTGMKAPSLLRRATASLASGANDRGVTTLSRENSGSSTSSGGGVMKRGGTSKSSLAYQARADERRAIVEASAVRRQENTLRIAELRRSNTAGGALGRGMGGKFE